MSFIPVVFPQTKKKPKKKSVRELRAEKRSAAASAPRPSELYRSQPGAQAPQADSLPILDDDALAAIVGPRERDLHPDPWAPARPETMAETGLTHEFLTELILKHL